MALGARPRTFSSRGHKKGGPFFPNTRMLRRMKAEGLLGRVAARNLRISARAATRGVMAAVVAGVSGGCTFGDVDAPASKGIKQLVYENCVPEECLYECCQGWNYSPKASLVRGNRQLCDPFMANAEYAEYDHLMAQDYNYCSPEFSSIEGGMCTIVRPPDVFKRSSPGWKVVYAGLNFITCAPRGDVAAGRVEDVTIVPQE